MQNNQIRGTHVIGLSIKCSRPETAIPRRRLPEGQNSGLLEEVSGKTACILSDRISKLHIFMHTCKRHVTSPHSVSGCWLTLHNSPIFSGGELKHELCKASTPRANSLGAMP